MKNINIEKLNGTPFQKDVWRALTMIPCGQMVSYKKPAAMCGHPNAVRAVANAVGKNPMAPIIPCHRVISSDGSIGGYSGVGGIKTKRKLLAAENVFIK
ncbi:MAG TPA: MGMT family protein [Alphaproteobacteria bacterium]|nr:MGMT family protein [Alphaproteobacteria bacterium]